MDASTGAKIDTVVTEGENFTAHGIAVDAVAHRLYVTNDNASGTEGVRVYDTSTFELMQRLAVTAPDYRSVAVDPLAGRVYIGHSSSAFEASGVRVLRANDLTEIAYYPGSAYGNKVYGISVDSALGKVYVSARDRFPAGLIVLQRTT